MPLAETTPKTAEAGEFNTKLDGKLNLKAGRGRLEKFEKRHGIQQLELQGEILSSDREATKSFGEEFAVLLEQGSFNPEFVYDADETDI